MGGIVTWEGKHYPVKEEHLTHPKAFMAAIGCQLMLRLYSQAIPDPKRAVLYHNAEEAEVIWPDARER